MGPADKSTKNYNGMIEIIVALVYGYSYWTRYNYTLVGLSTWKMCSAEV